MELESERFMREIAQTNDLYHTKPEDVRKITEILALKNEWVYHFFFMGTGVQEHMVCLSNWWIPPHARIKVLDVGSGSGVCAALLSKITDTQFTLLNIDEYQLSLTPRGFGLELKQGDMNDPWPFEAGSFDEVIMLYSLGHGKLDHVMEEAARVLVPKGGLFIYDTSMFKEIEAADRFRYVFYNPNRVIEEAERAGFFLARAGIPFPAKYRDITETLPRKEFEYYGPEPVVYRFIKNRAV